MIARMKFIKIAAPVSELDLVIDEYISKYEIQIENTVAEIDKITDLVSHNEVNPYKDTLHRVTELSETISECEITDKIFNNKDEAVNFINEYEKQLMDINKQRDEIAEELNSKKEALDSILPFKNINYDMQALKDFKFISYRFGRITKDYYKKLNDFSNEEMCQVFCECSRDSDFVWGVYFAPSSEIEDVDAIYMAMNFERLDVNVEYQGKINLTIAHELKHFICKDEKEDEDSEKFADHFGRFLLCPTPYLIYSGIDDIYEIMDMFGLTYSAAINAHNATKKRKHYYGNKLFDYEQALVDLFI